MGFKTRMVCVLALALFSSQCKKPHQVSTVAYIIGDTNDIHTIDAATAAKIPTAHLNSVVLIAVKLDEARRKFCSGTLVPASQADGNYRIITNHHCFTEDQDSRREVPRELIPNHCEKLKVYFGFYKDQIAKRTVGECLPGTFRSDYEGDLAVFTLKANPAAPYQPATFWPDDKIPAKRKARIIHFPIIEETDAKSQESLAWEETMGIALPVAQITDTNCETVGLFSQSEWGLDKALGMGIKHTCDQKKGSSGSSLWDVETNTMLGVNWGGISLTYDRGANPETYNVATRGYYVQAFLRGDLGTEKAKIVLGTELPDHDKKMNRASNNTKKALKTGCGVLGAEGLGVHFVYQIMLILVPILGVLRRKKN